MFVTEYPDAVMGAIEEGVTIVMIRSLDRDHLPILKKAIKNDTVVTITGKEKVLRKEHVVPLHTKVFKEGKLDELARHEMLLWEAICQITNTRQSIYGMVGLATPDLLRELRFTEIHYVHVEEVK
jgi:hypothetical protein